jgi:hypothetical protein
MATITATKETTMQTITKTPAQELAGTITRQINRMVLLGNLGAREFVALSETDEHLGGVMFRVGRGHHKMLITLNGSDTYTVQVVTTRSGRVAYEAAGVYCDQLDEILIYAGDKVRI